MNISGLLTSAGINIAICVVLLSLYSILRKQPTNASVYFGQRLALRRKRQGHFSLDRFVPSTSWIVKAWETTEEEIQSIGGLDAVVFIRLIVFSIRTFSIAAIIGTLLVLPVNYFGKDMEHKKIQLESLEAFTIGNVEEGSKWLWVHCLALYVLSFSSCILLYFEYKSIAEMRMLYITESSTKLSHFTVLVRSIPWSIEESYNDSVKKFFSAYHPSSYLSHQMVYNFGTMRKLMEFGSNLRCGICNGTTHSFKMFPYHHSDSVEEESVFSESDLREKECPAALVFFKSRYAALTISRDLHSANPMNWVTNYAPEPLDLYWRSLRIPYHQLWIRKIAVLLASIFFQLLFILPATLVQSLVHLEKLQTSFPFLRGILNKKYISQLVTGYLPSVVLMLFLYAVPPIMMLFSTMEGPISRSKRKKSACYKILFFLIWNVFFVNVVSGKVLEKWDIFSRPKGLPNEFAIAVPSQATFFTTYVLTSGWASISSELMQPFALFCNFVMRHILKHKEEPSYGPFTFPYHTEIPRVLLFGLLGFTLAILAPLILPFLLVYFFLAYLIYRNQIMNVYVHTYQSGGKIWPLVHNTTIFSLVFTQIIAVGVFGLRKANVPSAFTIPLIIFTLLFNEYCRKRFHPIFKKFPAEALIEMDRQDNEQGRVGEITQHLHSAYCQFGATSKGSFDDAHLRHFRDRHTGADSDSIKSSGKEPRYKNNGSSSSSAGTSLEIEQEK